jgi:hypothetical protein
VACVSPGTCAGKQVKTVDIGRVPMAHTNNPIPSWEAEIRRIVVWTSPGKKLETPSSKNQTKLDYKCVSSHIATALKT